MRRRRRDPYRPPTLDESRVFNRRELNALVTALRTRDQQLCYLAVARVAELDRPQLFSLAVTMGTVVVDLLEDLARLHPELDLDVVLRSYADDTERYAAWKGVQ